MKRFPLRLSASSFGRVQAAARRFTTSKLSHADRATIVEVGPRDGLQNEKSTIPLQTKLELIRRLAQTGITHMEAGSFVPAKWVPQVGLEWEKNDIERDQHADDFRWQAPVRFWRAYSPMPLLHLMQLLTTTWYRT